MIAGGSRRKISKGYSSYGKKSLPAAHREIFFGVIIHMVKNYCRRQLAKKCWGYFSYGKNLFLAAASEIFFRVILHMGKKSLPAAVGENFLGIIFHLEKNILLAAASEKFLRVIAHLEKKNSNCRHSRQKFSGFISSY